MGGVLLSLVMAWWEVGVGEKEEEEEDDKQAGQEYGMSRRMR